MKLCDICKALPEEMFHNPDDYVDNDEGGEESVREQDEEVDNGEENGTSHTHSEQGSSSESPLPGVSALKLDSEDSKADEGVADTSNTEDAEHDQDGEDDEDSDENDASNLTSTATSGAMPAQRPLIPSFFEQTCPHHPPSPSCAHPPALVVSSARSSCRS
jgi:hypothetical protein